jgi:RNA polymerase sigma-70 factor (ECF subfamily)
MDTETKDSEFNLIFNEQHKPVFNYVLRMVKERSVAEELTQDVFIKAYRSLGSFRGDADISTWIYRIATNACLDHFRSRPHRKSELTDLLSSEDLLTQAMPPDNKRLPTAEDALITSEMSSCVQGYIDDLPDDYRAVILLHDLQGFTNPEIAKITGTSLDNVKIRLHRARKKMKDVFSTNCSFYRDERNVLRCVQKEDDGSGGNL